MGGNWPRILAGSVLLTLWLSPLAAAQTVPPPPPGTAIFTVQGANGYQVTIFAIGAPEGTEGEGDVAVFASSARSAAIYRTSATVTERTIEAGLGELGRISVKRVRTDRNKTVPADCEGKRKRTISVIRYEGTIEFHGEEDFTEASASGAPFAYNVYRGFACAEEGGRPAGKPLPGAFLDVHRHPEENELMLHAIQRRPGAATTVSVQIDEARGDFEITRATGVRARAAALRFDPRLRRATLSPPAPFAGHATFRRHAKPANRWTGNLTVDLPGDSDYPLTGPGLDVNLVRPRA